MNMSEIFLMSWATIATILAVLFHHLAKRLNTEAKHSKFALFMLATGKATISQSGNEIRIRMNDEEGV